ncbi:MAG TPA: ABC transporter substrate-binding protein [Thermoanaerobaculia bacterium]|nr:ABC transporter substrate-binding protein [Thermoanaerobaculia bacterium]
MTTIAQKPEHSSVASPATLRKSIRVGVLSGIGALDPRQAGDTLTAVILEQVFESPYVVNANGGIEPWLFAEMLRQDRGGMQPIYSAAVRPGIVFSDGTPFTATLAAASLARTKAIRGRAIVTAERERVVFTMPTPSPHFENVLTQWNTAIVLERAGRLLGTGPYVLEPATTVASVKQSGVIRLARNERYWGTAHIDDLLFVVHPAEADGTPLRLIDAARRGEIDISFNLSVNEVTRYGLSGYQPMQQPSNSTSILYFNSEKAPLNDLAMRRALRDAIDTTPIAQINYERNHLAFTASDIIPPLMGKAIGVLGARDKELLRRQPNKPASLSLVVPWTPRPYILKPLPTAQEIARQLGAYGIRVDLIVTTSAENFFVTLARGEYDMALAGWVADNPDPAEFYDLLLSSTQVSTPDQYLSNLARWRRPEMDAALAAYRAESSPANRKAITEMIDREAILLPLVYGSSTAVRTRRVKNVHVSPAGHVRFADVDVT